MCEHFTLFGYCGETQSAWPGIIRLHSNKIIYIITTCVSHRGEAVKGLTVIATVVDSIPNGRKEVFSKNIIFYTLYFSYI